MAKLRTEPGDVAQVDSACISAVRRGRNVGGRSSCEDLNGVHGDEFFDVGAGEQIAVGKGGTHGFVNVTTKPAVHLIIVSPARHDQLLTALSLLPDAHATDAMDEVCRIYNQKIIGEPRRGPDA